MSFELHRDESLAVGVRRVVREQLADALATMVAAEHDSLDQRIHAVRRSLKRVRAVVRLLRDSIGDDVYRRENAAMRDAGRPLADVRDAKVLVDALDALRKEYPKHADSAPWEATRTMLVDRQRQVQVKALAEDHAPVVAASAIEDALDRLDDWSELAGDRQKLLKGLRRIYRSGRKAFDKVQARPSISNLHEWRRQVKYLRHALGLLTPTRPKAVGKLARQADELGELLGRDHDLAVLRSTLRASQDDESQTEIGAIASLIKLERRTLQSKALTRGKKLYRERPRKLVRRLKASWRKWMEKLARFDLAI